MATLNRITWTDEDLEKLDLLYPDGGAEPCMEAMPYRSRQSIMQRASLRGLRLKTHRGGKSWTAEEMKQRMERKPEGPYPWPPLSELDRIAQSWAVELEYPGVTLTPGVELQLTITRKGQLRPIVTVELEMVA